MKKTLIAIATASLLFTGCANNGLNGLQVPKFMEMKDVSQVLTDKVLIDELAPFKNQLVESAKDRVVFKENIVSFKDNKGSKNFSGLATNRFYESKIVNAYLDAVKKKGNTYKKYSGDFSGTVVARIDLNWYVSVMSKNYISHEQFPVFLEFDKNNNVVSALITHTEYYEGYNENSVSLDAFYKIYTNEKVSFLRDTFTKKEFEENELQ